MGKAICIGCYGFMHDHPPGPPCVPFVAGECQSLYILNDEYQRLREKAEEMRLFVEGIGDVLEGRTKTIEEIRAGLKEMRKLVSVGKSLTGS